MKKLFVGLCHRCAYAVALSFTVLDLTVLPLGVPEGRWFFRLLMALNLPVSLVSLALPYEWRGLDFPLGSSSQASVNVYWNHLLIAIPAYVGFFYLVGFLWKRFRAARGRSGRTITPISPYFFSSTHSGHSLALLEERLAESQRWLKLTVDQLDRGTLVFPAWNLPGLALGSTKFLIWGGPRVYLYDPVAANLVSLEVSDEVFMAYEAPEAWWLVCETSVLVLTADLERETSRFEHSEVIVKSWWRDDLLVVEDFEGRTLEVRFRPSTLEVRPA